MKSEVKETEKQTYPYLGKFENSGLIVLFIKPNTGLVVRATTFYGIGHFSDTWYESEAKTFQGTVTLSND